MFGFLRKRAANKRSDADAVLDDRWLTLQHAYLTKLFLLFRDGKAKSVVFDLTEGSPPPFATLEHLADEDVDLTELTLRCAESPWSDIPADDVIGLLWNWAVEDPSKCSERSLEFSATAPGQSAEEFSLDLTMRVDATGRKVLRVRWCRPDALAKPDLSIQPDDIEVLLCHPHGDLWVSLAEWIQRGPGPRTLLSPSAARSHGTGQPLPIDVIPLRYRNTAESRRLIETGVLEEPWPSANESPER